MKTAPRFVVEGNGSDGADGLLRSIAGRITWRAVVVTVVVTLALAEISDGSAFGQANTRKPPPEFLWSSAVILSAMAACILVGLKAAEELVARGARRLRTYTILLVLAAAAAAATQWWVRDLLHLRVMTSQEERLIRITQPLKVFLDALMFGSLASFVYVNVSTSRQAAARMRSAEIARSETSRRTFESQLQAMQARVEPQFLFNTLAQVKQLFDSDAELAGRMLDDLIAYLRAALPHLRETSSTLGKEIELARAYLNIMQVRLGERLAFDFDVPDAVRSARMPPMMLLPLIDHALVYGLEKTQSGGTLRITTRAADGRLRLSIADNGAGFVPGGHADDLKDIEARLLALYGDEADLELERMQSAGADGGTRATLEIPYETTDRDPR